MQRRSLATGSSYLKARVLHRINRAGYELTRDPFMYRYVRTLVGRGVDTVIDGGANTGQFARQLRSARFSGRIVSCEPLTEAFRSLSRAAARDPLWTVERLALSDKSECLRINISQNSVSSSALPMLAAHYNAAPESAYVDTEDVAAVTVDDLVTRHGIDPTRALLKLDVQGYESIVMAGAKQNLSRFAAVQMELSLVPLYEGHWLMPEALTFMSSRGFALWLLDPVAFYDPATGRMLQCDGMFFNQSQPDHDTATPY